MVNNKEFEKYENELRQLDLSQITPWGKYESDLERGVDGEDKVFEILSKYTSNIIRDVVLWGRKRDRVVEMDFVAEINGFLLVCEVKEWFGKMSLCEQKEKVNVSYVNTSNKYVVRTRTSPVYSLAAFTSDLIDYLKPNIPKKDIQLIRYVVFSRDDIEFDKSLKEYNTSIRMLNLESFEEALQVLVSRENKEPFCVQKPLPSWDVYYSELDNKWFKCAVLSKTIETSSGSLNVKDIDSIIFADEIDEPSKIKMRNGSLLEAVVDRRTIKVNSLKYYATRYYKYLKFNNVLHEE